MVRSVQRELTLPLDTLRNDLRRIVDAGIAAVSAPALLARALADADLARQLSSIPLHVICAGKASSALARALVAHQGLTIARIFAVGTHCESDLPEQVEWQTASHPMPDERSVAAARRALALAGHVPPSAHMMVLLSGGASALLAAPIDGLSLDDKRQVVRALLHGGADIHDLNAVRKHLSAIKGGRLAAACAAPTTTLAVSDVVGDDLSVIGSGPGVPDPSTWHEAQAAYQRWTAPGTRVPEVERLLSRGAAGELSETPKADDPALARSAARVIGGRADAMRGAAAVADDLGYQVVVFEQAITGEARLVAREWLTRIQQIAITTDRPLCVVSSGETTVRVVGTGTGGRNQEFALATVDGLACWRGAVALASAGTDGIDGPTDCAGAIADVTSAARARARGLASPAHYLDANDSFAFFDALGDLLRTGRTDTNVGDLQVLVHAPERSQ